MDSKRTHSIKEFLEALDRRFRRHRRWQVAVTCLSAMVVFATVYMLVLPAVTLESNVDVPGIELQTDGDQDAGEYTEGGSPQDSDGNTDDGSQPGGSDAGEPNGSESSGEAGDSTDQQTKTESAPSSANSTEQSAGSNSDTEGTVQQSTSGEGDGDTPATYDSPTDVIIAEGSIANTEITWRLVRDERGVRTLYVEGTGAIPNGEGPWASDARNNVDNIVIGEGITGIGNYVFSGLGAAGGLSIPKSVTSIGNWTFEKNNFSDEIIIPGTVKTVGDGIFYLCRSIPKVTFAEGVESIGGQALREAMTTDGVVVLPSTLRSVGTNWLYRCNALEYRVTGDADEPLFFVGEEDGVLYRYNDETKSTWTVIKYPAYQEAYEYVVPEEVTAIDQQAFRYCQQLQKVTVSDGQEVSVPSVAFSNTRIVEISLGDSVTFPSGIDSMFENSSLLEHVVLPSDAVCGTSLDSVYNGCSALQEAIIPSTVTTINDSAFNNCTSMNTLVFDAGDLTGYPQFVGAGRLSYDLVIGEHVDHLSADFDIFGEYAQEVIFAPNNYLTVDEVAFSTLSSPLSSLSGELYVDGQGVVYALDAATKTATVVYCSPGVDGVPTTSIAIPGTVSAADGTPYIVTAVGRDAIRDAQDLTSVTFQKPENIELFETNALANRPTLVEVNGKKSVEDVQKLFRNANSAIRFGYNAFANTGLEGSSSESDFKDNMKGPQTLTVEGEGDHESAAPLNLSAIVDAGSQGDAAPEWSGSAEASNEGGWSLLTGATLNISASANGIHQGDTYRIFAHFTDAEGSLVGFSAGEEILYDQLTVKCYATEDPYTFCYEITPPDNVSTLSFTFGALYPRLTSSGGGLVLWGEVGEPYTNDDFENGVIPTDGIQRPADDEMLYAHWKTVRQEYTVSKTAKTSSVDVLAPADGSFGTPADTLTWTISFAKDAASTTETPVNNLGDDHVASVVLSDTLTLPDGVDWKDGIDEAIRNRDFDIVSSVPSGSTRMVTVEVDGVPVFSISNTSSDTAVDINAILDQADSKKLVFSCAFRNNEGTPVGSEEMSLPTLNVTLYPDAVDVDMEQYKKDNPPVVSNTAHATLHYQNSSSKKLESGRADIKLSADEPALSISIESQTEQEGTVYLGENVDYTITIQNDGSLAYEKSGAHTVTNTLDKNLYLKPESIEEMFEQAEDMGKGFSLTISNALLASWEQVTPAYGTSDAYRTGATSDLDGASEGHNLVIVKQGDEYQLTVDGTKTSTAASVSKLLMDAGYDVTTNATYTCTWTLGDDDQPFTLGGGSGITFTVPVTAKNTFQHLSGAMTTEMPEDNQIAATGKVSLKGPDGLNKSDGVTNHFTREIRAEKKPEVFRGGVSQGSNLSSVQDLDVLDYTIDVTHWGNGSYENLPVVDSISGAQRLLIPVNENKDNPSLSNVQLEEVEFQGVDYYILDKEGTYKEIVVGVAAGLDAGQNGYWRAAQITVGSGTAIEWYAADLPAHAYHLDLGYQTIVQASSTGGSFTVGNTVRVNDRDNANIYTYVSGGGTMVSFRKEIVSSKGETPDEDTFFADQHSLVTMGQKVTYRLAITNPNASSYEIDGANIADGLPQTSGKFAWKRNDGADEGNVDIEFDTDGGVQWDDQDDWDIAARYSPDGAHSSNYYIRWPEGSTIKLNAGASVYIYVTLTYPSDDEWQAYVDAVNGNAITNTLWVFDKSDIVSHELDVQGFALLQKGVFATHDNRVLSGVRDTYSTRYKYTTGVVYYVALVNSGAKRLYLNDMQDQLPRGFSYYTTLSEPGSKGSSTITTVGGQAIELANPFVSFSGADAQDISCVSARVSTSSSGRSVRFSVTGSGSGENAIKYDEERDKYYLERNEALVFAYMVNTPESVADTDAVAWNTIAMPYTDYTTSGVASVDSSAAELAGIDIHVQGYTDNATYQHGVNDDTDPGVYTSDAVLGGGFGFTQVAGAEQWLMSQVSINRGNIDLRVEKSLDSFTTEGSETVYPYNGSINMPGATSNWTIRVYNDGDCTTQGYVITDKLPKGFTFVGNVCQSRVYNSAGSKVNDDTDGYFSVEKHELGADPIQIRLRGLEGYEEIPGNGDWHQYDNNLSFRIYEDADGCEVLQVFVGFINRLIPPGGYIEFTYSAVNASSSQASGVYQNVAYATPVRQTPSQGELDDPVQIELGDLSKTHVSNIQNLDGWSTRADAVMNITLSSATNSSITVDEKLPEGETNLAKSDWVRRSIRLQGDMESDDYGLVRYELAVDSQVGDTLDKLVLIDTLPREGDSNPLGGGNGRGSEYPIFISDEPNFKVTLQTGDGAAIELDSNKYRLEYKTDASPSFDGDDWDGNGDGWTLVTSGTGWSAVADSITAFRVVIEDPSALPNGAKIRVSFDAQVSDEAGADEVAWNSFGYRGTYNRGKSEFEAMPEPVGVRTPAVPTLRKLINNPQGSSAPVTNEAGEKFEFLLYEGDAILGLDVTTPGWKSSLDDRKYRIISVTVHKGESTEDLELTQDNIDVASGNQDHWVWTDDAWYNVVELPRVDDLYSFSSFTGGVGNSYRFAYDRNEDDRVIACVNAFNEWSLTLNKIDGDTQQPLSGSTFALYSPNENDAMDANEVPAGISPSWEVSGDTYYLMSVETIDDGSDFASHTWEKLIRSSYYLVEVSAPEGYALPTQGTMVYRRDAKAGVYDLTVENYIPYELPLTGGPGRAVFMGCGAMIAAASLGALAWKRRRGEGDAH